jgi:hypothetical protein
MLWSNRAHLPQRAQQLMAQDDEELDGEGDDEGDKDDDIEAAFPDDDDEPSVEEEIMTRTPGQNGVPPLPTGTPKLNGITRHHRAS